MPRLDTTTAKIEFDQPATIAELIEALEDLRAKAGPDATPRVLGCLEFDLLRGPRVVAISVDLPSSPPQSTRDVTGLPTSACERLVDVDTERS